MTAKKPTTIDEYIAGFPTEIQTVLVQIRALIKKAAPDADESISYGIPAFKQNGRPLVYIAGFKNHIGFYPIPTGIEAFKKEFSGYKTGKGSIQFPLDKPMPLDLIMKIVRYRIKENLKSNKTKRRDKTKEGDRNE
jgi:uncharacterized protein YdhG (YjbR/CyaY superfamily)